MPVNSELKKVEAELVKLGVDRPALKKLLELLKKHGPAFIALLLKLLVMKQGPVLFSGTQELTVQELRDNLNSALVVLRTMATFTWFTSIDDSAVSALEFAAKNDQLLGIFVSVYNYFFYNPDPKPEDLKFFIQTLA